MRLHNKESSWRVPGLPRKKSALVGFILLIGLAFPGSRTPEAE
jgi:hypothetical protein